MKNKFIALLFITLSLQTIAKNDSTSVVKNGIGISIAPMFSMPTDPNGNLYGNSTKGSIGGTAALCQNIVLSKKQNFYLYTELGFQTYAYINNYAGYSSGSLTSSPYKFVERTNYGYFSLSLQKVIFKISNKLGMFVGIGAQASYCYSQSLTLEETYIVNGQTKTNIYTNSSYHISPDNQWAAAGVARLGFMVNPVKHLSLNIAPIFYYGLNPNLVFKNNNLGYNSLGLNLQIMYSF
ncbi:MAG TPA: hypothetical protein VN698_11295 [Bacteroidia bacterium]|nr:hypothetical protein [Bacteroidia bacterium]